MSLKPIGSRVRVKKTTLKLGAYTLDVEERSIPGQDDPVYEKNKKIWEEVPRGQANITISKGDPKNAELVCTLRGLRKFGYTDAKYGYRSQVATVVAIDKENGECAHISAFEYDGAKFWVVGSKHVHLVVREALIEQDLSCEEYKNMRYRVATKIATLFFKELAALSPVNRTEFFNQLAEHRWTANAEAIFSDSQHIVDYNGVNQLRWFAISNDGPSSEGLCMTPEQSEDVFKKCGLHAITRSVRLNYRSKEYDALVEQVGQRTNSEGVVMYGSDADGRVVCLWKEKSYPYIMERVVREAIKRGMVGSQLQAYVQGRLQQQKTDLRRYFHSWEQSRLPFLVEFAAWIADKFPIANRDAWAISCQWLSLQREFAALPERQRKDIAAKYRNQLLSGLAAINSILLVGPPGSGKSSLARSLTALLQRAGKIPVWLNQDETGGRKQYLDAIRRTINNKETTHVILDKSNLEKGNRDDYVQLGLSPAVTIIFQHPEGSDAFRDLCVRRIMARGDGHRSLCPSVFEEKKQDPAKEITKIIGDFLKRSDIEESMDDTCITVDTTAPMEKIVTQVWEQLTLVDPSIPPIDSLSNALGESMQLSAKYETLLTQLAASQQLYAAITIPKDVMMRMIEIVPKAALIRKALRDEFHVTVRYFGGVVDPVWFVEHAEKLGQKQTLHITEIVFDDNGCAAVVEKNFACSNPIPHITIACSNGTPPVYSNTLIAKAPGTPGVVRTKVDAYVDGVYAFM